MADKGMNTILVAFVLILIGITLVNVVSDSVFENTNPVGMTNETLDITTAKINGTWETGSGNLQTINQSLTFTLGNDEIHDVISVTNASAIGIGAMLYVEDTDWNHTGDTITFFNSSAMVTNNSNLTFVTYTYATDNYVAHSTARTLINLIPLFFVIGFFLIVIYAILKDTDFMDKIKRGF